MIKIDKGIPMPELHGGKHMASREATNRLEIGDSFLATAGYNATQINNALYHHARRRGVKIIVRTTPDGVRVWRVA